MYKQYSQLKNQIMGDKMLSAEGKRLKIKELNDKAKESLQNDVSLNKLQSESVSNKIKELKTKKFTKKLPTVDVPGVGDLYGGDKVVASLLGQQVALMAEQRMSERLVAKLSMESNHRKFTNIIDDCLYEQFGPSAVMRSMSQIKALSEKFDQMEKAGLGLSDLYTRALDAEKTPKEKAWEVAHGEELKQLESRSFELMTESISLGNSSQIISDETNAEQQDKYFGVDVPVEQGNEAGVYFEGR